jgi:hypothetical protein
MSSLTSPRAGRASGARGGRRQQAYLTKLRYEASASISSGPSWPATISIGDAGARMISFAPLFEPPLQVEIDQSSQPGNVSHALGVRPMTRIAGHNVGFRNSVEIDRSSPNRETPVAVIGGFWTMVANCQIMRRMRAQGRHRTCVYRKLKPARNGDEARRLAAKVSPERETADKELA